MAVRIGLALVLACTTARAEPARFGRIDVYSARGDFTCRNVRVSPGARFMDVGWRGPGKAATGGTAQTRITTRWRQVWIEVVPEADGALQINFQGEYYRKRNPADVRRVWVDRIEVTGGTLVNGDLEDLDGAGRPRGWTFSGPPPDGAISANGKVAHSGKVFAAVWYGSQLRQVVQVKRGRRVRVSAWFRATARPPASPEVARHRARFAGLWETSPQVVRVRLKTPAAAARATLTPALLGGAQWAITSRWDDNNLAHLKMRKVLLAHAHRGTFYLNDPRRNSYGSAKGRKPSELGGLLLGDGITLGGHSLTHPMLSYQNRNRIFEEVLGVRVALEAAFDTRVSSYAFSFCDYRSPLEGAAVQRDIAVALARAGYLQVANHRFADDGCWPFGVAGLLPPDGRPIDNAFAAFLADPDLRAANPCITFSMHTWYRTPQAWAKFESELDRYGRRPRWWYCNQNEYGAYRTLYAAAVAGKTQRSGREIRLTLQRPALVDLNDPVPLTFLLGGARAEDIESIQAGGARIGAFPPAKAAKGEGIRFHVYAAPGEHLPEKVDHLPAAEGDAKAAPRTTKEFPFLAGRLRFEGEGLTLLLKNTGRSALTDLRVCYRLPLLAERGIVLRPRQALPAGKTLTDQLALGPLRGDPRYRAGTAYAAVQVDFLADGKAARLFLTAKKPTDTKDASYPRLGFSLLGPIPESEFDLASLPVATVRKTGLRLASGKVLSFRPVPPAVAAPLGAEVIGVRGVWGAGGLKPCAYLLASTVTSSARRTVQLAHSPSTVRAIWLNGARVDSARAVLQAGENPLLLLYEPPVAQRFSREHAGTAFRIADPATGRRIQDIHYRP